jgi:hypothetical protein
VGRLEKAGQFNQGFGGFMNAQSFILGCLTGAVFVILGVYFIYPVPVLPKAQWNITINGVTHKFDKDQNYIGTEKE